MYEQVSQPLGKGGFACMNRQPFPPASYREHFSEDAAVAIAKKGVKNTALFVHAKGSVKESGPSVWLPTL